MDWEFLKFAIRRLLGEAIKDEINEHQQFIVRWRKYSFKLRFQIDNPKPKRERGKIKQ